MTNVLEEDTISKWDGDAKLQPLDEETYNALVAFMATDNVGGWTPCREALLHAHYSIQGLRYKCSTAGERDSVIFFQPKPDEPLVPGVIRQILSIPRVNPDGIKTRDVLLAVQRYKPLAEADHYPDPFKCFVDFGAGVWRGTTTEVVIINPSQKICHAICRKWDNNILVMRPLNWVSHTSKNDSQS
jgi:hypothetical protein